MGPKVYKCDVNDCPEAFAKFSELKSHKINHYSGELITEEVYGGEIDSIKLL